jgi:hypothetical protein
MQDLQQALSELSDSTTETKTQLRTAHVLNRTREFVQKVQVWKLPLAGRGRLLRGKPPYACSCCPHGRGMVCGISVMWAAHD